MSVAQKLPTRQNVEKVVNNLNVKEGLIYLKGQVLHERDDTDVEQPFRQESNFFYVTGKTKTLPCLKFLFIIIIIKVFPNLISIW
jgi:Xaa-Pro dipeptidase